jgi:hypothetical protein
MPALITSGRCDHAATSVARSGSVAARVHVDGPGPAVCRRDPGDRREAVSGREHSLGPGRVILIEGKPREGRSAALFGQHLDDLRRAFRHYEVIHVLCDSAGTHRAEDSKLVRAYSDDQFRAVSDVFDQLQDQERALEGQLRAGAPFAVAPNYGMCGATEELQVPGREGDSLGDVGRADWI